LRGLKEKSNQFPETFFKVKQQEKKVRYA